MTPVDYEQSLFSLLSSSSRAQGVAKAGGNWGEEKQEKRERWHPLCNFRTSTNSRGKYEELVVLNPVAEATFPYLSPAEIIPDKLKIKKT